MESYLSPCPLCNSEVTIVGSSSYPEDGVNIECKNAKCEYDLDLNLKGKPWEEIVDHLSKLHNHLVKDLLKIK